MGRLRKKAPAFAGAGSGKARESRGMRRTVAYAAMTKDDAQRSIRTFYVAVMIYSSQDAVSSLRSQSRYSRLPAVMAEAMISGVS
jgi:hypothetical protein